jgi:transcriptional regulator with GAF, ATPase, and Fis domain
MTSEGDAFDDGAETVAVRTTLAPHAPVRVVELRLAGASHALALDCPRTLGSAPGADLRLPHPTVSRLHARLEVRAGVPWVEDLGSTNGVFVGGIRVGAAQLVDGARLQLGSLTVEVGVPASERREPLWPTERFGPLLGRSAAMRALFERVRRVAASDACVFVHGETGTGKDLVARAIHDESPRRASPFVVFDCSAVPEALFEAELFGHTRGAFTGADRAREGAAAAARGGTLFLDEVGELPLTTQPKLLRMLETGTIRRVGEARHEAVDVRVVAATHRDLAKMVAAGTFREDLYFRLVVLPLEVPALHERPEDIPLLIAHFAKGREVDGALLEEAVRRRWPGNVRELRAFVERALALGTDEALRLSAARPHAASSPGAAAPPHAAAVDLDRPLRELRDEAADAVERAYLAGWLDRCGRNVTAVAQAIGLDRTYVHRLMRKHSL